MNLKPICGGHKVRLVRGLLSFTLFLSTLLLGQQGPAGNQRPLAFTHVTVIDCTGAHAQPDMTVVVSGGRITELGKDGKMTIPPNALVTNAKNKFMIPGLWDMHTHAFMRKDMTLPLLVMYLFVTNGVTGVRDMGDLDLRGDFGDFSWFQDVEWRQAISTGTIIGPRLVLALTIVNGPSGPGYPRSWASVANEAQGRDEVAFLKKRGADFIKVYDQLPREVYYAIADETKKQGLPFAGHVPIAISAAEASDAGQKSLEHNFSVLFGCSSKENELMQKEEKLFGTGAGKLRGLLPLEDVKILVDSYSDDKATSLFARFVKNDTYVTPTLVNKAADPVPASDPRVVKYFSPALRDFLYPSPPATANPDVLEARKLMYRYHFRIVAAEKRSGVKLLAGTDSSFFGSSLHDELAQLVKAGLTPMEALQTATRNPAEYFGKLDSMGTVEKGKVADLVLLDANPLDSIDNTRKISAVVVNGRLLDRKSLDHLLAQVESATK
jgi:hypothetical protein